MNVALRPERLDILSICTGGGGLDLGVELAIPAARVVCMVEREAFAVAHLVAAMREGLLHPAPVWSDARTFGGRAWRGCLDGLIGGIPCQPHSLAGKRLAELDERDLWPSTRRIIVQGRPWFVLIENVGGMLSSGGAERVWRDLRRLGFACEIGLFTAAEVGASHERERLFILACHDGLADADIPRSSQPGGKRDDARQECTTVVGIRGSLANAKGLGCDIRSGSYQARHRQAAVGFADGGGALVDAASLGRGEGRPEPELRRRRDAAPSAGDELGNPSRRHGAGAGQPQAHLRGTGEGEPRGSGRGLAGSAGSLFPPGPHDRENWQAVLARTPELEPAFRRVADGLASRLDLARIERLRMLGNGVVPLEAGFALRTLGHALARRSVAAARLVRMMADA